MNRFRAALAFCFAFNCLAFSTTPVLAYDAVSAGELHTCALQSGRVACWGDNLFKELGTATDHHTPVEVEGLTAVAAIAAGGMHTCALDKSRSVYCWGSNLAGQVADDAEMKVSRPHRVPLVDDVQMLVAGGLHTCALARDGRVLCWGGHSFNHTSLTPAQVVEGIGSSKTIAAGGLQTCAVSNQGEVHCWNMQDGVTPAPVKIPLSARALAVAAGGGHACALSEDHRVMCWRRGGAAPAASMTPHWIEGLKDVRSINAGLNHTCAVTASGFAACWGANDSGQLGTGTTQNSDVPAQLKLRRVRAIAAGTYHTCALDTAGKLRCWGNNLTGELGTGDTRDSLSAEDSVAIKPL